VNPGLPVWIFGCTSISCTGLFLLTVSSHGKHGNHTETRKNKESVGWNPCSSLPRPPHGTHGNQRNARKGGQGRGEPIGSPLADQTEGLRAKRGSKTRVRELISDLRFAVGFSHASAPGLYPFKASHSPPPHSSTPVPFSCIPLISVGSVWGLGGRYTLSPLLAFYFPCFCVISVFSV